VYKDPLKFNEFEFKNLIDYFSAPALVALVGYWNKSYYFAFCCFYGINLGKKLWHSSRASTFLPRVDSRAIHFFHLIERTQRRAGWFFS
jgi:hypothetical protein